MSGVVYVARCAALACSWFLLVNVVTSACSAQFARRLTTRDGRTGSPAFWFGLRLLPAVAAFAFVAALFLPSYVKYEPRESVERFDVALSAATLVTLGLCAAAAVRGLSAWWSAARRTRIWMQNARPLPRPHPDIPAFEVDADAPLMALVGLMRPRLFVTRGLIAALTSQELEASIAHEIGHWRARDNVKRLALRAAPDILTSTAAARAIERRWAAASEFSADRLAGHPSDTRCALASALIKVARLTPAALPQAGPISTLVGGGEIASRVERLLDDDHASGSTRRSMPGPTLGLAIAFGAVIVAYAPLLRAVHQATEFLVRSLP